MLKLSLRAFFVLNKLMLGLTFKYVRFCAVYLITRLRIRCATSTYFPEGEYLTIYFQFIFYPFQRSLFFFLYVFLTSTYIQYLRKSPPRCSILTAYDLVGEETSTANISSLSIWSRYHILYWYPNRI